MSENDSSLNFAGPLTDELNPIKDQYPSEYLSSSVLMASTFRAMGRFDEAKTISNKLSEWIAQNPQLKEENHVQIINARHLQASLLLAEDQYDEAISLYRKNLQDERKYQQSSSTSEIMILENLSHSFSQNSQWDSAIWYGLQGLALVDTIYKTNPSSSGARLAQNLAIGYLENNELKKALEYSELSVDINLRLFPDSLSTVVASSLQSMADMHAWNGNFDEFHSLSQKAIDIHKRVSGEEHIFTGYSYFNYAYALYQQGMNEKALEYINYYLDILHKQDNVSPYIWAEGMQLKGLFLHELGRADSADHYLNQSIKMYNEVGNDYNEFIAELLELLVDNSKNLENPTKKELYTRQLDSVKALLEADP